MDNTAVIKLTNLATDSEQFPYDKIMINGNEYKVDEGKPINVYFDDFEKEMGSKIVKCEFIDKIDNINDYRYFEVIQGNNNGFLFPERGVVRDIVFLDDSKHEVKIECKRKIIYESYFCNRFLLINVNEHYDISIDKIMVTENIIRCTAYNSAQVVPYNLEYSFFCYKEISQVNYKKFFKLYDLKRYDSR
jgi:hypothetical protein